MSIWLKLIAASGNIDKVDGVQKKAIALLENEISEVKSLLEILQENQEGCKNEKRLEEKNCGLLLERRKQYRELLTEGHADNDKFSQKVQAELNKIDCEVEHLEKHAEDLNLKLSKVTYESSKREVYLKRLLQQWDTLKAFENMQKAKLAIAKRDHTDGKIKTALELLDEVRRQNEIK